MMATGVNPPKQLPPEAKSEAKRIRNTLLVILPLLLLYLVYHTRYEEQREDRYFKNLDLKLTGVVRYAARPNSSNNFGVFGLDVLSTNKANVDQRDSLNYYYCLVKNGKAELYQGGASSIREGDTLTVDSPARMLYIRQVNGTGTDTAYLQVYENDFFWRFVKKHYQRL